MTYRQPEAAPRGILVVALGGEVVGIDRETGVQLWENGLRGGGLGNVGLAMSGERVLVSAHSDQLFCLDYRTGTIVWQAQTSSSGRATILIDEGQIVVSKGGHVDSFTWDGRKQWSQPLRGKGLQSAALGFPDNVVQSDAIGTQ
jgi:outer membrane protein assembly factor BamB